MTGPSDPSAATASVDGPWSPLRITIYRALWIAGLASNVGTFMHLVAAGWAMSTISDSPTLVSLVQTAWGVPGFLLALHAGVFADLVDRRRLIIATQVAALGIAAALGGLQLTHHLPPVALLAGTFLESVALTMAAPAFMALTPELVGLRFLPQAIGLDSISRNLAQSVGPALAGVVIAIAGPGAVFLVNAASFVGVVGVVSRYRTAPPRSTSTEAFGRAIRAGVRTVVRTVALRRPVIRLALLSAVNAAIAALMPVVARRRLHVAPAGFGILAAALGVGSVAAAWALPRLRATTRPERTVLGAAFVWSAGAATFGSSTHLATAVLGLLLAGAGAMATLNVFFSTYTLRLPPWMRGRGSSMAMLMVWLGASAGAAGWGALASGRGVRAALFIAAVVNIGVSVLARWSLSISTGDDVAVVVVER